MLEYEYLSCSLNLRKQRGKTGGAASGDSLTTPMQGTIVKVEVTEGQTVAAGDLIVVLEAMKMEQPLTAHKAGTITGARLLGLEAEIGTVEAGKLADLLLVDGDPLTDLRRLEAPGMVIQRGAVVHPVA